jgi:predicted GH43/DUF377 family glycosyl hydrolase
MSIQLKRTSVILRPDQSRVLLRPFSPGDARRVRGIVARIMLLPDDQVGLLLDEGSAEFSKRHQQIYKLFRQRFERVRELLPTDGELSEPRQLLIGSYFLAEYSLESAALFNPSIVPHPDQTDLPAGALRFVLSLRATGEGHISSITFRTGVIHPDHRIEVLTPTGFLTEPRQIPNLRYEKALFMRKLVELGLTSKFSQRVMNKLGESFGLDELRAILEAEVNQFRLKDFRLSDGMVYHDQNVAQGIWMLARSNYQVQFQPDQQLSERIIFPATPSQRNGIEDARFVCFKNDDGTHIYYATFTAFDGRVIMPELVETSDFRQDNENVYIMFSDNVHLWNERKLVLKPVFPWELVQLGNCGSPIETDAGWLVLSHGVGPVRKYCIGAFLLDRNDPSKVVGRLREPLIKPSESERVGYVPNVVYTCGALVHRDELIIPYAMADHATGFATVPLAEVLAAMHPEGC